MVQDSVRRKIILRYETKRRQLLWLRAQKGFVLDAVDQLSSLPKNASPTRAVNRCVKSGRSNGILSTFRLSRLVFRKLALQGLLPGIRKTNT